MNCNEQIQRHLQAFIASVVLTDLQYCRIPIHMVNNHYSTSGASRSFAETTGHHKKHAKHWRAACWMVKIVVAVSEVSLQLPAAASEVTFEERSDPDAPVERIIFDQAEVEKPLFNKTRGKPKNAELFAKRCWRSAWTTLSRELIERPRTAERVIDKFLQVLGLRFLNPETHGAGALLCGWRFFRCLPSLL